VIAGEVIFFVGVPAGPDRRDPALRAYLLARLAAALVWLTLPLDVIVVALLVVGNLFCMAGPFMLIRNFSEMRRWRDHADANS